MTQHHHASDEGELDDLVAEFSERRTYRPSDDLEEPDDVPQAPSGTAMGDGATSD
ncbi:hypothetical protein M5362_11735 [Streptomyces sp. Je 1-79]|uniref:hypothetical protein n=1 Tax=Streptomyces sp. Je 1-79 TaxID=2943847 RepID=UPI0021A60A91|nr:hypothetical protein [Streptomyces sp. Je 1-79]MCT4353799.1 hypothetical protein [Streptomyces sp. Je 1-79]